MLRVFLISLLVIIFVPAISSAQDQDYRRPEFSLPDLTGQDRAISEWDGNAMLINFWATWCIPCKREIPMLNQLSEDYHDTDFQVLGIAVDNVDNIQKFMEILPLSYLTLAHEDKSQEVANQFSNSFLVLPFTVFLDHQGRIFWMQVEEIHREEVDAILNRIWQVKSGELQYEDAQLALMEDLDQILQSRMSE
jgi:thiol-disulfide isomerase/thioredoxin